MGQNALLSSNPTNFIDSLIHDVISSHPISGSVLSEIISVMKEDAPSVVRRYFVLYTIPILEISGLIPNGNPDELSLWGLVQTQLGVYIRYADDVVDGDCEVSRTASVLLASHRLLSDAKQLISEHELVWDAAQDDLCGQYLAYESENRVGFHHGFDSLWRRVSPLCVVPETYLRDVIPGRLLSTYKQYLAWSLLQSDCDDSIKDLTARVNTPVTRALRQSTFGVYLDWGAGAEVVADIKQFLKHQHEKMLGSLEQYPTWRMLIQQLDTSFAHPEQFS
jgi:hypothetical protein